MERDDPLGDDEPQPRLLPPDDRLWRHPSEVADHGPSRGGRRRPPPLWLVATSAGVLGALLTLGLMAATGNLRRVLRVPVVERVAPPGNSIPASRTAELARRLQPTVVNLEVETGGAGTAKGAGVMFRSDGHLLTNSHVVADATRVVAIGADGRRTRARVVAADAWSDLAVVKVDGDSLTVPVAVMGTATGLAAAQEVIAIGGEEGTGHGAAVELGTIGAVGQVIDREDGRSLLDMIRTDMPVAANASGGALFDRSGALVGILTALAPPGGGGAARGGYATPVEWARRVAEQLLSHGRVVRVWAGIGGNPVPADMAARLGLPGGVLVDKVGEGSPAVAASVAVGDVVAAVDGKPVESMDSLKVRLRVHEPGDVVTLQVVRGSLARPVKVRLEERPAQV